MPTKVTDPNILRQLEGGSSPAAKEAITDPAILDMLNREPGWVDTAVDMYKSAGTGLTNMATGIAGMPGDARTVVEAGAQKLPGAPQSKGEAEPVFSLFNMLRPSSGDIQHKVEEWTGPLHKPQTPLGEYTRTAFEFAPGAAFGGGGVARRVGANVLAPAITSETAGQVSKGQPAEPYWRAGGAVAGALAPHMLGRAITPLPATQPRQQMVDALAGEGVHPTAGQRTGSRPLQWMESALGDTPGAGGRAAAVTNQTSEQFTAATLRRAGIDANRATPEVIDQAFTRLGNQFDGLAARNVGRLDAQVATDVRAAVDDYYNLVAPPNRVPAVTNFVQELVNHAQRHGGNLPGEVYQSLRSRIEGAARGMGNNPEARNALRELRESIDDMMERSIAASNPADLGAWREVRNQYRNMLVIEKAATGAGADTAMGLISPSQLRNAVVGQNRRAYARGEGDFAELSRAGEALLKPLPQSGTTPRMMMQGGMSAIGAAAGSPAGGGGAVLGAMGAMAVPPLVGRALMSPIMQGYLGNQVLANVMRNDNPRARALSQVLLSGPRTQLQLEAPR